MEDNLYIPRRLNDPAKLFIFDADSAMLFLTALFLGIMAKQVLICSTIGMVLTYMYSKTKSGKHPAFALHFMYWYIPGKILQKMPSSSLREYIG